jgi:hypothetical protein
VLPLYLKQQVTEFAVIVFRDLQDVLLLHWLLMLHLLRHLLLQRCCWWQLLWQLLLLPSTTHSKA